MGGPDPCTEWGIRWASIEEAGRFGVHPRSNQSLGYTHAPTCGPLETHGKPNSTTIAPTRNHLNRVVSGQSHMYTVSPKFEYPFLVE